MKKFYNFLAAILAVGMVSVSSAQVTGLASSDATPCPADEVTISWDEAGNGPYTVEIGNSGPGSTEYVNVAGLAGNTYTVSANTFTSGDNVTVTVTDNSATPVDIALVVNEVSVAPTGYLVDGTTASAVCEGDAFQLATVGGNLGTAGSVEWYADDEVTPLNTGNPYNVPSITTPTTYKVRYEGECGNTTFLTVSVGILTPAEDLGAVTEASNLTNICIDPDASFSLSVNPTELGGGEVNWYVDINGGGFNPVAVGGLDVLTIDQTNQPIAIEGVDYVFEARVEGACDPNTAVLTSQYTLTTYNNASVAADDIVVGGVLNSTAPDLFCPGTYVLTAAGVANGGDNPATDTIFYSDAFTTPFLNDQITGTANSTVQVWVEIVDGCTGTLYQDGPFDVDFGGGNPATSAATITTTVGAVAVNTNDFVCDNTGLDFEITDGGSVDLGPNGEWRIYEITATATNLVTSNTNEAFTYNSTFTHTEDATYHFVIVNDCDSLGVADGTPAPVKVNTYTTTDIVDFVELSVGAQACIGESITMVVKAATGFNDTPVVEFFSDDDGVGTSTIYAPAATFNAADSTYTYVLPAFAEEYGGGNPVYYGARLNSACATNDIVYAQAAVTAHTNPVLPTDIDVTAGAVDADLNNIADAAVCTGTTVTLLQTGGSLGTDGSEFEWRYSVNAGTSWTIVDSVTTNDIDIDLDLAASDYIFDVRVVGGACGDLVPAVTDFRVSTITAADTLQVTSIEERDGSDVTLTGYNVLTQTGADAICSSSDLVLNFVAFDYTASTDNPQLDIRSASAAGSITGGFEVLAGQDLSGGFERVISSGTLIDGDVVTVYYDSDCLAAEVLVGTFTVNFKDDNVEITSIDGAHTAVRPDGNASGTPGAVVNDNDIICFGEDVMLTVDGILGDTTNFFAAPGDEPYFEWSLDGFVNSSFTINADSGSAVSFAEIAANDNWVDANTDLIVTAGLQDLTTASVRMVNGCNDVSATVFTFTVDVYDQNSPFSSISLDNDNFCTDEGITATMIANSSNPVPAVATVEWWTIDDEGNPEALIQGLLASAPNALTIAPTPTVTTTYGARIIMCYDTTAFEVRTVTVKDTASVHGASISASPSAICEGATSTMTMVDHILGTNGNVVWYDDANMTNKLATGPSFTSGPINTDTTFYAFVEADCDTTVAVPVTITISNVEPGPVGVVNLASASGDNCEGSDITVSATGGSPITGSYIWEISKNGGATFETSTEVADNFTFDDFTGITYDASGEATLVFRVARTNGCFTTSTTTGSITVRQNPENLVSLVADNTTICAGDDAELTVTTGDLGYNGTITWTDLTNGVDLSGFNNNTVCNVTPASTSVYQVQVIGTCGNSDIKTITINVNEAPVVSSLDIDQGTLVDVCDIHAVDLASTLSNPGTPAATLQYQVSYNGITFSDINAANLTVFNAWNGVNYNTAGIGTVNFKVIATNVCGTSEATIDLTVNKAPEAVATITVSAIEACISDATPIDVAYLGGDLGVDGVVTWTVDNSGVLETNGNTTNQFIPNNQNPSLVSEVYEIDLTIESDICEMPAGTNYVTGGATTTATIIVHPTPVNGLGDPITTLCSGDAGVDLTAVAGYNANGSFSANAKTLGSLVGNSYTAPVSSSTVVDTITYSITENGCTEMWEVFVEINGAPSVAITSVTNTTCGANDGEIVAVASNGSSTDYEYSLNAGFAPLQTNNGTFTGLAAGGYTVYIRNVGALCVVSTDTVVQAIGAFTVDALNTNDVSCLNGDNGSIDFSITGGVSPYNYFLVANDGVNPNDTTEVLGTTATSYEFGGLEAGITYEVIIQDANCEFIAAGIVLNDGNQINLTVSDFVHIVCPGDATGSFNLEADKAGYTGDFEFSLNGGAFFSNTEVTGLEADVYEIIVRDDSGCEADFYFSLEEPTAFDFDVQIDSVDVNSWDVEITNLVGGTGVKEASIDGGAFDQIFTFTDLADGEHTITIRDEEGCTYSRTITLGTPVGIEELKAVAEVSTFPNPFNNEITVVGLGIENATVVVTDLYGKQIGFTANSNENEIKINAADWANGVYLIHVSGENFNSTERVIKK